MITATEPLEYFPRGRQVADHHPGPIVDEELPPASHPVDFVLLRRLENVNISLEENEPAEYYRLREVPIESRAKKPYGDPTMPYLCTEEELYVRGHTAVWTRCMKSEQSGLPHICFTCDSTIRFAFFCPDRFVRPDTESPGGVADRSSKSRTAICLIDTDTVHVYRDDGVTYRAMLQCPVVTVWPIPHGIMFERDPAQARTLPPTCVPWPRLFTLTFPLEEMKPVLLATEFSVSYMDDTEYRVVFSSERLALVLLYGELLGKHFICILRPATEEELLAIQSQTDTSMDAETGAYISMSESEPGEATLPHNRESHVRSTHPLLSSLGGSVPTFRHASFQPNTTPYAEQSRLCDDMASVFGCNRVGEDRKELDGASIAPQYCLQHIWVDEGTTATGPGGVPIQLWSAADGEMASVGFLHTDLVGNSYLCFLQPRACRLTLVQYDTSDLTVIGSRTVPARSAIALDRLNMIVLLDLTGKLVLYSGPTAVGKLHVTGLQKGCFRTHTVQPTPPSKHNVAHFAPSSRESFPRRSTLLPNVTGSHGHFEDELHLLSPVRPVMSGGSIPSPSADQCAMVELRDATGSRFTLVLADGRLFRLALAPVAGSPLVRSCLNVLQHVLPRAIAHDFIIRWYGTRNVPGSDAGLSTRREWALFRTLFFTAMGRPIGPPEVPDGNPTGSAEKLSGCGEEPKKRRRAEDSRGQSTDWEFLVRNATGVPPADGLNPPEAVAGCRPYQNREPRSLYSYIPEILQSLHLLYEELKLDVTRAEELRLLADALYCLASDAQLTPYQLHYFTDYPALLDRYRGQGSCRIIDPSFLSRFDTYPPAHLFRYIEQLLSGTDGGAPYPYRAGINEQSADVLALLGYIYHARTTNDWVVRRLESVLSTAFFKEQESGHRGLSLQHGNRAFELTGDTVLAFLAERGYTRDRLEHLPVALRYVVLLCLEACRPHLTHGQRTEYYELLLRPELRAHGIQSGLERWAPDHDVGLGSGKPQAAVAMPQHNDITEWQSNMSDIEVVGTIGVLGSGSGLPAVASTVSSTSGATGPASNGSLKDDSHHRQEQTDDGMSGLDDEVLQLLFPDDRRMEDVRTFLNSSTRVRINITQSASVPDHEFVEEQERSLYALCLRTMALPVGRGMFTVCSNRPLPTQSVRVPRLCLTGRDILRGATVEIQQIEVPTNMSLWPSFHNGVAAGLRICPDTPHLTSTWITHNRQYQQGSARMGITSGPEASTEHGGFLLALGLTGHLRELSMYNIFDYMVRSDEMVRLGLLLGLAAAHRGTADLTTTRLLAVHVEALLPPTAVELDVSQNLQVAALLGAGLLYQGTAKRHMAEVLLQEIGRPPGPEMENYVERESYALTAGLALGLVTLGRGECSSALHDLALPDTLYYYMNGSGSRRPMVGAQKDKYRLPSFQIREGSTVNVDVTAPGATLALGLMYFATGNEAIARWLEPPATNYMLGFVRPDLLLLRTVARHLIHWDAIKPSRAWLEEQIPDILRHGIDPDRSSADEASLGALGGPTKTERQLYCQAYCSTVCGSAVAIGLRYAGTSDAAAVETLDHYLCYFIELGKRLGETPQPSVASIGRLAGCQAIENCTVMVLLALSLVLAGTGDLIVLRAVRLLRARIGQPHVTYGSHMAIHMALGFLFLGGGRFTLARTPAAIAALVCSIFPKFPTYSNDNRYHLQAFRHLYVLAIEPRIFLPRHIATGRLCICRIRFVFRADPRARPVERYAPCLLPELDTLEWVEMCDENFWSFRFDQHNWEILERIIRTNGRLDVNQHIGCLSYQEDPMRLKTSQMRPLAAQHHSQWNFYANDLLQLSSQQEVVNVTNRLLILPDVKSLVCLAEPLGSSAYERFFVSLYSHQVKDCVMNDRLHGLPIFLDLTKMLHNGPKKTCKPMDAWQVRLLTAAMSARTRTHFDDSGSRALISVNLLRSLVQRIWTRCDEERSKYSPLIRQYLGMGTVVGQDLSLAGMLSELATIEEDEMADNDLTIRRRRHLAILMRLVVMYDVPYGLLLMDSWHQYWAGGTSFSSPIELRYRLAQMGREFSARTIDCIAGAIRYR